MYEENAYCNKCGRPIQFLRMKSGKLMPVDGFSFQIVPGDKGGIYFKEDGSSVRGTVVSTPGPNSVKAWQSHFATCPEGENAHRQAEKAAEKHEAETRSARERLEKEIAEAEAKAARRAEKERKEAAQRAFEKQQLSFFAL